MTKHIGIVACSAEGAALCYQTICREAPAFMGEHNHPEISMHTFPLSNYMDYIRKGDWQNVAGLMLSSAQKLETAGADLLICPDNTIHQAFDLVTSQSSLPWLHIAEAVAFEAQFRGFQRLGITGTKYLMTGPVYPDKLKQFNLSCEIPDKTARETIDGIIFNELVNGIICEESRLYFNSVIQQFRDHGCDAVVLGCTEIPLLIQPHDCPLPPLDSTRLLARAALKEATGNSLIKG